jgi:uncharacterized cupredoxin-like copper-binding protein
LTAASLAVAAAAFVLGSLLMSGQLEPQPIVVGAVVLAIAGVAASGVRWTPLLGAIVSGLLLTVAVAFVTYDITHPTDARIFAMALLIEMTLAVGVLAGIGATWQNYRTPSGAARRAPRWVPAALFILGGAWLGGSVFTAIAQANAGGAVSAEALSGLPAVTTEEFTFGQKEIQVKAGELVAFRLENRDAMVHSFDVDELGVHAAMPAGKSGLALFRPTAPGTYTFYCGVPGHRDGGMVGTLIVS